MGEIKLTNVSPTGLLTDTSSTAKVYTIETWDKVSERGRLCSGTLINLLKPTGYVMHHTFNIRQLYALPTLYLCVLYLSENKQRLVSLTA